MQQFWIADTITDVTEKSYFLSLIFQMQPMNQIACHKAVTSIEFMLTSNENIVTVVG